MQPRTQENTICWQAREQDCEYGLDQRRLAGNGGHGPDGESCVIASLWLQCTLSVIQLRLQLLHALQGTVAHTSSVIYKGLQRIP